MADPCNSDSGTSVYNRSDTDFAGIHFYITNNSDLRSKTPGGGVPYAYKCHRIVSYFADRVNGFSHLYSTGNYRLFSKRHEYNVFKTRLR